MPTINFKEIAKPTSGANRDSFELFAREFLVMLGYKIVSGPDRGADGKRDLIVEEVRTGIGGETRVKWLVSCKHKAHSGDSVKPDDEPDIHDRLRIHECQGFLGFYSTLPSSGLSSKLDSRGVAFETQVFDREKIEKQLLVNPEGIKLAKRFFPKSIAVWEGNNPNPAEVFREEPQLSCAYCGKNLLQPQPHGIVVTWRRLVNSSDSPRRVEHVYWCCKGACDYSLKDTYKQKKLVDGWKDISDLVLPVVYIQAVMGIINRLHTGFGYTEEALDSTKELLLNLYPMVARNTTSEEKERIGLLIRIPSYWGGLGDSS